MPTYNAATASRGQRINTKTGEVLERRTKGENGAPAMSGLTTDDVIANTEAKLSSQSDAVTSQDLASNPGFVIPKVPPATGAAGLQGELEAGADQFTKNLEARAQKSEQGKDKSLEALLSSYLSSEGEVERTTKAYAQTGGVDDIEKELNTINQDILKEQQALRRQVERIEENKEGLFGGGVQNEVERVTRESLRKQADMAVIQMGVQGRFDSAKAIADRAIAVQLERQKRDLDIRSLIYQENKSLYDKDEQRLFESKLEDRKRAFEAEERQLQEISDLSISALENGAPSSIVSAMRNAKDAGEAIKLGGSYIGLIERQKAQASMASASLANRKARLELALAGDPQSIRELGYDPRDVPLSEKDIIKNEDEYTRIASDVARIDGLLANEIGVKTTSGAVRSPLLSSTFNIKGGLLSYPKIKTQQQDFLTGASYVIDNLTFDKLLKLKAEGATFGALSDNELRTIGNAAGELSAMAIKDNGTLVGFRGSEEKLRQQLDVVRQGLTKAQNQLNADLGINRSERNEITEIYYGTNK